MSAHPLAGSFSVDTSARLIRHYRYVEERMMRLLGGWIALTPEVPVKLLFGRHVWDCAQHADLWGRRLPELRAPAQESEPANPRVVAFVDLIENRQAPGETPERVAGIYRVLKPHLIAVYERHLADSNAIYEPPTRRILQRCLDEERRHVAGGALLIGRLGASAEWQPRAAEWEARLMAALADAGGVTGAGDASRTLVDPPSNAADGSPWHPARDVVALGSAFDSRVVPLELAARLASHGHALVAADRATALRDATADAAPEVDAAYAELGGGWERARVVGCARIGAYRVVKLVLENASGRAVLQLQWRPTDDGWRIAAAQIVSAPSD